MRCGEEGVCGTRNKKRVNDVAAGNYLSAFPIERSNGRTKAGIAFNPGRVTRYRECRGVGGEEKPPLHRSPISFSRSTSHQRCCERATRVLRQSENDSEIPKGGCQKKFRELDWLRERPMPDPGFSRRNRTRVRPGSLPGGPSDADAYAKRRLCLRKGNFVSLARYVELSTGLGGNGRAPRKRRGSGKACPSR